jgi:glucose-6-phosphate isomerase
MCMEVGDGECGVDQSQLFDVFEAVGRRTSVLIVVGVCKYKLCVEF